MRVLVEPSHRDSHQSQSSWQAVIVPLAWRDTWSGTMDPYQSQSHQKASEDPVLEDEMIVLGREILSFSIEHSKAAPAGMASLTLAPNKHWAGYITPGDWVLVWAHDDAAEAERILRLIKARQPANDFKSGLRFLGRVQDPSESVGVASFGAPEAGYTISAKSFEPMESQIYYAPELSSARVGGNQLIWVADFAGAIESFVLGGDEGGGVRPAQALSEITNIVLGLGSTPEARGQRSDGERLAAEEFAAAFGRNDILDQIRAEDAVSRLAPNRPWSIPPTVAKLLGVPTAAVFSDLLVKRIGLQVYADQSTVSIDEGKARAMGVPALVPDPLAAGSAYLAGLHRSTLPSLNQVSLWSVLSTYLAAPINEHYTSLEADGDGNILPHYIARQNPLTSDRWVRGAVNIPLLADLNQKQGDIAEFFPDPSDPGTILRDEPLRFEINDLDSDESVPPIVTGGVTQIQAPSGTPFLSLPRWVLSQRLRQSRNLAPSDSARINYVHLTSQDIALQNARQESQRSQGYEANPPLLDEASIRAHGLRMYTRAIEALPASTTGIQNGVSPNGWGTSMLADILFPAHLKWSGTVTMQGVDVPISVGQNIQIDGGVFHVESISHSGQSNGGKQRWNITMRVSSGVSAASEGTPDGWWRFIGRSQQKAKHLKEYHETMDVKGR